MDNYEGSTFQQVFIQIRDDLVMQPNVNVGEWQSQHNDEIVMKELLHVGFEYALPDTREALAEQTGTRMPWAEDHFQERVSGIPMNPSPSEAWWPFAQKKRDTSNGEHKSEGEAFSHTYPERMWPKHAEMPPPVPGSGVLPTQHGIRFDYGDLDDVVNQLVAHPMTRQAYLPIWFPEDTGAVHGKRVPCTLGYHFIIRDGYLDITYFMRSTDLLRHFQDDIYLAGRLAQWVVQQILSRTIVVGYNFDNPQPDPLQVGRLIFHTANMHIFAEDVNMIQFWKDQGKVWF